jgi:hypothetical protein
VQWRTGQELSLASEQGYITNEVAFLKKDNHVWEPQQWKR